jgi:Holliday junction resolvase RusA-like endonuclease
MRLELTLPIPPSDNHCYPQGRGGRRFLSPTGKKFKRDAQMLAKQACNMAGWPCVNEKVVCEFTVYWPDKRRRDGHNLKLLWDALQGYVYSDDHYALVRNMDWHIDRGNPRVEITCYPL